MSFSVTVGLVFPEHRHGHREQPLGAAATAADGFAVVLATEPARSGEFFRELQEVVRHSRGGVLISLQRPSGWLGGPVVGVHPRRDQGPDQRLYPGVWLGPLRE